MAARRLAREDAGTLALLAGVGWEVHIATAAIGDCGSATLAPEEIASIRREEAKASAALLGGSGEPQSLNDLARAAGMDKSQMSRVVSGLTGKRIVRRETDAKDARGIRLSLTLSGKKLYQRLIRAAAERNSAFLGLF